LGKKKQSASTPATAALDAAGISYVAHSYAHSDSAESYGAEAAEDLAVAVVPVAAMLDLKAVGAALGKKRAQMADKAAAQRRSGYVLGGISPFGQRQRATTVIDSSAQQFQTVFISGGRRGFSLEIAPEDAVAATSALWAPITS